jgi:hypothetical protein
MVQETKQGLVTIRYKVVKLTYREGHSVAKAAIAEMCFITRLMGCLTKSLSTKSLSYKAHTINSWDLGAA